MAKNGAGQASWTKSCRMESAFPSQARHRQCRILPIFCVRKRQNRKVGVVHLVGWIKFIASVVIIVICASILAAYAFGRFAEGAKGEPSRALAKEAYATTLDRMTTRLMMGHAGETGLTMLSSNLDAFAARALAARAAGRSLDLMYYIWNGDLTGRLLMDEVILAADRGVRVRLLLDDIGVETSDAVFLALDSHPNIELRLFNPTRARARGLRRGLEMALRAFSVTRRMHNKAWIADGRVAIVGGRNIGDEYFDAAELSNFRDLDLMVFGEVVDQTEKMFDEYWNSGLALPITSLADDDGAPLSRLRDDLQALRESDRAAPYIQQVREHVELMSPGQAELHWTQQARLVADPAEKAAGRRSENWLMQQVLPLMAAAEEKIEITSPYFIPGDAGVEALVGLAQNGVSIDILTNSLAATDVAAVHGGYAPYRKRLLRGGVALYELRPTPGIRDFSLRGSSNASLHTKAFTVDGRLGFIGSLNFDPRSSSLNTEMGVLFEIPALVAEMSALFSDEISPDMSYALHLNENGRLRWHAQQDGLPVVYDHEPEAGWFRLIVARIVGLLPLESQL